MWCYGIRSNIPFSVNEHYFLVDIDAKEISESVAFLDKHQVRPCLLEETQNGFHIYCFQRFKFEELVVFLPLVPNVDKCWFQIGLNRGYWFLRTCKLLPIDAQVQFMRLYVPEDCDWLRMKRPTGWMNCLCGRIFRRGSITGGLALGRQGSIGESIIGNGVKRLSCVIPFSGLCSNGSSADLSRLEDTYGREFRHGAC